MKKFINKQFVLLYFKTKKMKNIITTIALFFTTFYLIAQDSKETKLGDKIADFSAFDDQGNVWKSDAVNSDFLVVYFYPAAMTGGCTAQACAYRDDKASFDELGVYRYWD